MRRNFDLVVLLTAVLLLAGGNLLPAADFNGAGGDDYTVFRPSLGLWAIRGYTRWYFGGRGDVPLAYDPAGTGRDYPTIFRPSSGLFAVRGITRVYFGAEGDLPIGEGYGPSPGPYDYIVRPGDAADLVNALESTSFTSVFIPAGTYHINSVVNVTYVRHIVGEETRRTVVQFHDNNYLLLEEDYCHVENIQFEHEEANPFAGPLVGLVGAEWVLVENCRFDGNDNALYGLQYDSASNWLKVLNCYFIQCTIGANGDLNAYGSTFSNCQARNCGIGFNDCENLSSCFFRGAAVTQVGFDYCRRLAACEAAGIGVGFNNCKYLSSCRADGSSYLGDSGFGTCEFISSCAAYSCTWGFQTCNGISSSATQSCVVTFVNCDHRDTVTTWSY